MHITNTHYSKQNTCDSGNTLQHVKRGWWKKARQSLTVGVVCILVVGETRHLGEMPPHVASSVVLGYLVVVASHMSHLLAVVRTNAPVVTHAGRLLMLRPAHPRLLAVPPPAGWYGRTGHHLGWGGSRQWGDVCREATHSSTRVHTTNLHTHTVLLKPRTKLST